MFFITVIHDGYHHQDSPCQWDWGRWKNGECHFSKIQTESWGNEFQTEGIRREKPQCESLKHLRPEALARAHRGQTWGCHPEDSGFTVSRMGARAEGGWCQYDLEFKVIIRLLWAARDRGRDRNRAWLEVSATHTFCAKWNVCLSQLVFLNYPQVSISLRQASSFTIM